MRHNGTAVLATPQRDGAGCHSTLSAVDGVAAREILVGVVIMQTGWEDKGRWVCTSVRGLETWPDSTLSPLRLRQVAACGGAGPIGLPYLIHFVGRAQKYTRQYRHNIVRQYCD
eukprot:GDKH01028177.1.p1 GENE.GDKH01028177.1~~GDKH01028177.1.p1  ORF type:complete len:114 (+),score=17.25 GDKH01028177.1:3-344(+)